MKPKQPIPVIDLFAGPGGLGEGFSSLADGRHFKIAISVEKDARAHETLRLRAAFRALTPRQQVRFIELLGSYSPEVALAAFPMANEIAAKEAIHHELRLESSDWLRDEIQSRLGNSEHSVLIGGPPCQAYSLVGRSRNNAVKGYRLANDERHDLYLRYLRVIADHWPSVFVMENVKGLLSASLETESIFQRILTDLEDPARAIGTSRSRRHRYRLVALGGRHAGDGLFGNHSPSGFIVRSEKHGVPQARHRLIVVGIRDDLGNADPEMLATIAPVPASLVLDDLPRLRSGVTDRGDSRESWVGAIAESRNSKWLKELESVGQGDVRQHILGVLDRLRAPSNGRGRETIALASAPSYAPGWYAKDSSPLIFNHSTRGHIASDLHRYLYVASHGRVRSSSPSLSDFPPSLYPDHRNAKTAARTGNLFSDRFRVQLRDQPSTTITSHISKDGHYFIHHDPSQCRSLTVREAARLQTFPDSYFFCGPRTSQYIQVGNAVPPLLARAIAHSVHGLLRTAGATE